MGIDGLGEQDADHILELIEALTVIEGEGSGGEDEQTKQKELEAGGKNAQIVADESEEQDSSSEVSD